MKKTKLLIGAAVIMLFAACKEEPILIPDPSLNVSGRSVLVEEGTGVRCQNCPQGTQTLVALQQQYGAKKLIVVSLHAAVNFSVPFSSSAYDFRNPEVQALADYIGVQEGWPTAAINRRLLPNETSIFLTPHTRWGGEVAQDLQADASMAINIANTFDHGTRELAIKVDILPDQLLQGEHRLTVLITQDSIQDPQLNGSTVVPNYIHRHVARDVVSAPSGDVITETLEAGVVITKNYKVTLPADFDEHHCSVVAYVARGGNPDKQVLQAAEKYVTD
ncbi:MAG TPA: Omp28-related outer membrane protein [Saprospiraceae bacterium]|nr:Omp28-related outer membrane protein [Saprospiraceae bacterium]